MTIAQIGNAFNGQVVKTLSSTPTDSYGGLTGSDRDAAAALTNLFQSYGLGSLAPAIIGYIKNGYSADTASILLQDTPEYKQRFAANDIRAKKGLPVLTPSQYLATEASYRQVMQDAGVPKGFYDSPSDFQTWLANDVSPTEIKSRVDAATQMVNSADKDTLDSFKKYYSTGDMVAFALDQNRAAPLVGKAFAAAQIGGAAQQQNLSVDRQTAEGLAGQGISQSQAQQGFAQIATDQPTLNKLAQISGSKTLTQSDLINEVFYNNAQVAETQRKLASQERGRFNGTAGAGANALSTDSGGQI